ncbi:MAG TPA: LPS export ABC transporter periplasmic protein LptC [Usitatibacter sp.]|nr:LPS export ABC transporter periplasmic protein LptC [Usitatibacter sp.]
MRPTTWLPLAVLALLVALTLWLNELVRAPQARESGPPRHDPDAIVEKFDARKFSTDGRLLYTLAARKMVHYPDDDTAHLDAVKLEAFEPGQPKMTVTADEGRLERTGDRVWIEGHVVLVREGDAKMEPARVTTDRLLVLPDSGIARTSSEVTLESPSSHVVAQGLELDNKTRTLVLDRVHAIYKSANATR